jgi:hypothetical protein
LALVLQRQFRSDTVAGGFGTRIIGLGVWLVCFSLAYQGGVFLHHHPSHDICIYVVVLSQ